MIVPGTNVSNALNFYGMGSLDDWKTSAVRTGGDFLVVSFTFSLLPHPTVGNGRDFERHVRLFGVLRSFTFCFRSKTDFMSDSLFFSYSMPKAGGDKAIPTA